MGKKRFDFRYGLKVLIFYYNVGGAPKTGKRCATKLLFLGKYPKSACFAHWDLVLA